MQSTRQDILDILKAAQQATVEDLAQRLELTPMTIRHHLNVLQAQNLVTATKVRRLQTVGRPRLVYALTEAAANLFPHGYGELARHLVGEVKDAMGPDQARQLLDGVAARIASEVPPPVRGQTFEARLEQITEFLKRYGFMFRWDRADEGYILTNINCPYRRVSEEHSEVCGMDAALLERLLQVKPRHVSRLRKGSTACTWLVREAG